MSRPASRVVFVGNIPYGLTEEQITEIFSQAGRVQNFRLVYDRETGRPKGFGFAEYPDTDSAASAVRNLNDYEIMGRKLRVDFSNESGTGDDDRDGPGGNNNNNYMGNPPSNGNGNSGGGGGGGGGHGSSAPFGPNSGGGQPLPPLPAGRDLPAGVSCADAISRTLNTLPPQQLLDILQQMKSLATADPARCADLLGQAPQLGYAVFQALLIMGLVSPDTINSVLDEPASAGSGGGGGGGGYPGAAAAAVGAATHTPPVSAAYAPPPAGLLGAVPMVARAALPPAPPAGQDPEALMRAVMELPEETVNQLPEAERQQILALRASFAAQRR